MDLGQRVHKMCDEWTNNHKCSFKVDVPVIMSIYVDGYDTEEEDDLKDRIDCAIYDLCEVLYNHKKARFFNDMKRDYENLIKIIEIE